MKRTNSKITYVTYNDLAKEDKHGYEVKQIACSDDLVMVRPQVIPGLFGYPDLHINVLIVEGVRVFANTDYALTETKKAEIEREAIRLLQAHKTRN